MINPDLERRYAQCQELVGAWKLFLDMVTRAVRNPDIINPQTEKQFLAAKARIAMLHDAFMDSLRHDKGVGTNMLEIVNRSITLRSMTRMSEAESKKLELEWHEAFLLINETVTTLAEEREELAGVNEFAFKMGKLKERVVVQLKSFFLSIYFKILVGLAALAFIIWGIPAMGIYDWDKLRDIRALETPVSGVLFIGRAIGMHTPYYRLADFTEPMLKNPVGGITPKVGDGNRDLDWAKSRLPDGMLGGVAGFDDIQKLKDEFAKALSYERIRFLADGGDPDTWAYIFYFRRTAEANRVYSEINRWKSQMSPNFIVVPKSNILVILQSTNPDQTKRIKENYVDRMKP
jgi:hypothetical protein